MKKFILALFAGVICFTSANLSFSDDTSQTDDSLYLYYEINDMIENKIIMDNAGLLAVKQKSAELPYFYKQTLYDDFHKNGWGGFGLNLLVPSLGNFIMGDTRGGIMTLSAIGLSFTCFILFNTTDMEAFFYGAQGAFIWGAIRNVSSTFVYAKRWNKNLESAVSYGTSDFYSFDSGMKSTFDQDDRIFRVSLLSLNF